MNTYSNGKKSLRDRQPWRYMPRDSAEYAAGYEAHYGKPWLGDDAARAEYQRHFEQVLPHFLKHGKRDHNGNLRLP